MNRFVLSLAATAIITATVMAGSPPRRVLPMKSPARAGAPASGLPAPRALAPITVQTNQIRSDADLYDPFGQTRKAAWQISTIGRALYDVPPWAWTHPYPPYLPPVPQPYLQGTSRGARSAR
jgi:hypothetical protein